MSTNVNNIFSNDLLIKSREQKNCGSVNNRLEQNVDLAEAEQVSWKAAWGEPETINYKQAHCCNHGALQKELVIKISSICFALMVKTSTKVWKALKCKPKVMCAKKWRQNKSITSGYEFANFSSTWNLIQRKMKRFISTVKSPKYLYRTYRKNIAEE